MGKPQEAFEHYLQSGFSEDTGKNYARDALRDDLANASNVIVDAARNEELDEFRRGVRKLIPQENHLTGAESARDTYDALVKMIYNNIGPDAAATLQSIRYAKEPV